MDRALLERVLHEDPESIALFGESDHCAVIDWRDGPEDIVGAIAPFLPEGYLSVSRSGEGTGALLVRGKPPRPVTLAPRPKQEPWLLILNEALAPEFELRQFRPFDGDGYSVFVAPTVLWREIEESHAAATERLFLSARRLALHWSKGYLARLFSKP